MKYIKTFFESNSPINQFISDIYKLDYLDNEDEIIDENKKKEAIDFVKKQYNKNFYIPYFISPTVYQGVLVEYKKGNIIICIRFEDKPKTDMIKDMTISDNGKALYNDVFNQDIFDSYLID